MDQEKLLNQFKTKGLSEFIRKVYFYRMLLAYLFRRFDVAAEMAQEYQLLVISNPVYPTYEVLPATLYLGLIAGEMLRRQPSGENVEEERAKWQTMASSCLEKLKNWDAFAHATWLGRIGTFLTNITSFELSWQLSVATRWKRLQLMFVQSRKQRNIVMSTRKLWRGSALDFFI